MLYEWSKKGKIAYPVVKMKSLVSLFILMLVLFIWDIEVFYQLIMCLDA